MYTSYSPEAVKNFDGDTVVFFHASWCGSCNAADENYSNSEIPEGLMLLKADFDSNTDLRKTYGIVNQHTFVQVDANGGLIKKWVGGSDLLSITSKL